MDWDVGALVEDTDKLSNFVEDDFDIFEYEQGRSSTIVVAGGLKSHIQFWRSIGASQIILDVIEHGYRIPFHSTPPVSFSSNNKSALAHSDFVNEAISELLVTKRIFGSEVLPHNVNPLSVSVQSSGKKRLILDLRFVNKHVWKHRVKFEDLKVALNYFDKDHFMFSFVLKRGYHHVVIFPPHQTFWVFPGFTRVRSVSFVSGSCPSASVQPLLFSQRFLGLLLPTGGGMVFTLLFILTMV